MAQATPPSARVHALLARLLEWAWPTGAAWAWRDAAARAPRVAEIHFRFGSALGRLGRWPDAARSLARAAQLEPASREFQGALAIALDCAGQQRALVHALERFAELCPGEGEPQLLVGVVLRRAGRTVEAMRAFRSAVRLAPAPGARRFLLAEAILGARGWQQAVAACTDARCIDSSAPRGAARVGRSALQFHPGRPLARRPRRDPAPSVAVALVRGVHAHVQHLHARWLGLADGAARAFESAWRLRALRRAWRQVHAGRAVRWGAS